MEKNGRSCATSFQATRNGDGGPARSQCSPGRLAAGLAASGGAVSEPARKLAGGACRREEKTSAHRDARSAAFLAVEQDTRKATESEVNQEGGREDGPDGSNPRTDGKLPPGCRGPFPVRGRLGAGADAFGPIGSCSNFQWGHGAHGAGRCLGVAPADLVQRPHSRYEPESTGIGGTRPTQGGFASPVGLCTVVTVTTDWDSLQDHENVFVGEFAGDQGQCRPRPGLGAARIDTVFWLWHGRDGRGAGRSKPQQE